MGKQDVCLKGKKKIGRNGFFFWETYSSVGSQKQGQLRNHTAELQKSNRERKAKN